MKEAEEILELNDLMRETIDVPEWKKKIIIREATSEERVAYDMSNIKKTVVGDKVLIESDWTNNEAKLVVKCCINEDGTRVFTDEQATPLGKKSGKVVRRLFKRIQEISGMTIAAEREAEANFAGGGTSTLPTSLPDGSKPPA